MSEAISHSLRVKEEREMRVTAKEEAFSTDAVAKLVYCFLHGEDLHDLIEELSADYWDIFNDDLSHSDINLLVTEAVAFNIRSAIWVLYQNLKP